MKIRSNSTEFHIRLLERLGGLLALRGLEAKYGDRMREMNSNEYIFEMRRLEREYLEKIAQDPAGFLDVVRGYCEG